MRRRRTMFVDSDILVIGGGMGGCGATYKSRYWGRDLKIVCVEKANIERTLFDIMHKKSARYFFND